MVVTLALSPATCETISPRIEKLATTLICAIAVFVENNSADSKTDLKMNCLIRSSYRRFDFDQISLSKPKGDKHRLAINTTPATSTIAGPVGTSAR